MSTYAKIEDDIRSRHGKVVKPCWIAHVKESNGLPLRKAPNRQDENVRIYECPSYIRPLIEDSMRRFGMLA